MGHQREIVLVCFPEADAGVEADAVGGDAHFDQNIAALFEVAVDIFDDIVVARVVLHGLGRALHVHGTNGGLGFGGESWHGWVAFEAGDVVDDFCPGFDSSFSNFGFGGVDRYREINTAGEGFDDGDDTVEFLLSGDGIGMGPSAFAADVEDVCAVVGQLEGLLNRCLGREELTAVGKTIGSDVDDAHEQRSPVELKNPSTELPVGGAVGGVFIGWGHRGCLMFDC